MVLRCATSSRWHRRFQFPRRCLNRAALKLLIDSSKWLRPKLEICAKSLAPMTVLVRCTNNVMVSADRSDVIDGDSRGQNAVVGYDRHTAVYVSQKVVHQTHGDNFVNS